MYLVLVVFFQIAKMTVNVARLEEKLLLRPNFICQRQVLRIEQLLKQLYFPFYIKRDIQSSQICWFQISWFLHKSLELLCTMLSMTFWCAVFLCQYFSLTHQTLWKLHPLLFFGLFCIIEFFVRGQMHLSERWALKGKKSKLVSKKGQKKSLSCMLMNLNMVFRVFLLFRENHCHHLKLLCLEFIYFQKCEWLSHLHFPSCFILWEFAGRCYVSCSIHLIKILVYLTFWFLLMCYSCTVSIGLH